MSSCTSNFCKLLGNRRFEGRGSWLQYASQTKKRSAYRIERSGLTVDDITDFPSTIRVFLTLYKDGGMNHLFRRPYLIEKDIFNIEMHVVVEQLHHGIHVDVVSGWTMRIVIYRTAMITIPRRMMMEMVARHEMSIWMNERSQTMAIKRNKVNCWAAAHLSGSYKMHPSCSADISIFSFQRTGRSQVKICVCICNMCVCVSSRTAGSSFHAFSLTRSDREWVAEFRNVFSLIALVVSGYFWTHPLRMRTTYR